MDNGLKTILILVVLVVIGFVVLRGCKEMELKQKSTDKKTTVSLEIEKERDRDRNRDERYQ